VPGRSNTASKGSPPEAAKVPRQRPHQRLDPLVLHQADQHVARVLQARGEEVHSRPAAAGPLDPDFPEVVLAELAGQTLEAADRAHGLLAQLPDQLVDRGLAAPVAALAQASQHFQALQFRPLRQQRRHGLAIRFHRRGPTRPGRLHRPGRLRRRWLAKGRPRLGRLPPDPADGVRTETPVSLAIRSCGTPPASSNWISRRFPPAYMDSSCSEESARGLLGSENTGVGGLSGPEPPAIISGIWAVRFSGTRKRNEFFGLR